MAWSGNGPNFNTAPLLGPWIGDGETKEFEITDREGTPVFLGNSTAMILIWGGMVQTPYLTNSTEDGTFYVDGFKLHTTTAPGEGVRIYGIPIGLGATYSHPEEDSVKPRHLDNTKSFYFEEPVQFNNSYIFGGAGQDRSEPGGDGTRVYHDGSYAGDNKDYLVIEKTDWNQSVPDGGIVYTYMGNDNVRREILRITKSSISYGEDGDLFKATDTGDFTIKGLFYGDGREITHLDASKIDRGTIGISYMPVTNSRDAHDTTKVLRADGMYDHVRSGDHDGRYVRKDATVDTSIRVRGTSTDPIIEIYANGSWRQVFPAQWA